MTNENDNLSEQMYNKLVCINQELLEIGSLRINKANNLIIFNSAIMAVLVVLPFQFIINSIELKMNIYLLYLPIILFFISTHFSLKIFKKRQ